MTPEGETASPAGERDNVAEEYSDKNLTLPPYHKSHAWPLACLLSHRHIPHNCSKGIPLDSLAILLSTDFSIHPFGKMVVFKGKSYPERTIFIQVALFVTFTGEFKNFSADI